MNEILDIITISEYYNTKWCQDFLDGLKSITLKKGIELKIHFYDSNTDKLVSKLKRHVVIFTNSNIIDKALVPVLIRNGISPLVIYSSTLNDEIYCNSVSIDYFNASLSIVKYFIQSRCKRISFFALNQDSSQDMAKYNSLIYASKMYELNFSDDNAFVNSGSLSDFGSKFVSKINDYDAIVCANDAAAISLVQTLKKKNPSLLKTIRIASFGGMLLAKMAFPEIVSVVLDFYELGVKAADLYLYISKNPNVGFSSYSVKADIAVSRPPHTSSVPPEAMIPLLNNIKPDSYSDSQIFEIFKIENLLSNCDNINISIIKLLSCGATYEHIAEELDMPVSSVKLRLKNIITIFGVSSRKELVHIFKKYL